MAAFEDGNQFFVGGDEFTKRNGLWGSLTKTRDVGCFSKMDFTRLLDNPLQDLKL